MLPDNLVNTNPQVPIVQCLNLQRLAVNSVSKWDLCTIDQVVALAGVFFVWDLSKLENQLRHCPVDVLMPLFLKYQHIRFPEPCFNLNQLCLLLHMCRPAIQVQHFSFVVYSLRNSSIKFIQRTFHNHHQIFTLVILLVIQRSKCMTEQRPLLWNLLIDQFGKSVVRFEKFLKYFIWVVCESVPALELALREQALSQFLPTVLVVKCPFYWIAQDFIGFRDFRKMVMWCFVILFGEFRMPSEYFLFVTLGNFLIIWVPFDTQNFVVIFHHFAYRLTISMFLFIICNVYYATSFN